MPRFVFCSDNQNLAPSNLIESLVACASPAPLPTPTPSCGVIAQHRLVLVWTYLLVDPRHHVVMTMILHMTGLMRSTALSHTIHLFWLAEIPSLLASADDKDMEPSSLGGTLSADDGLGAFRPSASFNDLTGLLSTPDTTLSSPYLRLPLVRINNVYESK